MPYIGKTTDGFGVRNRFVYLASSGDTSVSGADANGATLTFTDGAYVDVYLNGVLLKPTTDYNTSTANTIAGLSALNTNDEVTVVVYDVFTVADMVSATSGGTFSGNVTFNSDITVGDDIILNSDSAAIKFGADSEITLTHDADSGLTIKHDSSADNKYPLLTLAAGDNDISANDVLGQIRWIAPDEGTGTDAVTMAGNIQVVSEGDFAADNNAVYMSFATGLSGAATDKLFLNSAGNVGIGVVSPTSPQGANFKVLDINSGVWGGNVNFSGNSCGYIGNRHSGNGGLGYYAVSGQGHHFAVNGANDAVVTINSDGRIGVGDTGQANTGMTVTKTVSSATLKVTNQTDNYQGNNVWSVLADNTNDTDCFLYAGYSAGGHRYFVAGNGNVTNVNNSYGSYSDEKLKENISDASSQWDDIKGLKVRNFSWKADSLDKANMIGLIAQEAEKISPNLIQETKDINDIQYIKDEDGKDIPNPEFGEIIEGQTTKTLKYSVLYMKAIKALQEAMARIETLEAKVKTLEEA